MPVFAVKEIVVLVVVTRVEAETHAQAQDLVEMLDVFDYDDLLDSRATTLAVWNEETGETAP